VLPARILESFVLIARGSKNKSPILFDGLGRLIERQATRIATGLEGTSQNVEGTTLQAFEYDGLSRMRTAIDNNDPGDAGDDVVTSFSFDSLSRRLTERHSLSVQGSVTSTSATFGRVGFSATAATIDRTVTSAFDLDSNRVQCVYPTSGRVLDLARDGLDRIQQISDGAGSIQTSEFIGGRVQGSVAGNGVQTSFAYDLNRRVTDIYHSTGPTTAPATVAGFGYQWDRANRRTSEATDSPLGSSVQAFAYDSAYRVTAVSKGVTLGTATVTASYQIDGVGNWASRTEGGERTTFNERANGKYAPDLMNEYSRLATYNAAGDYVKEVAPVQDANGNQIDSGKFKLSYDLFDRLVRVERTSDGVTVGRYYYDAGGRRVRKLFDNPAIAGAGLDDEIFFVCDGSREIEEVNADGSLRADYVWGGRYIDEIVQMRRGGQEYYMHSSSIYSVAAVTDAGGTVVERYAYTSIYGVAQVTDGAGLARAPPAEIGNPWRFQGRRLDSETGFYFFRHRYLDPGAGRFVSRDPLGLWGDPGQLGNAYSFAGNDPVNRVDPLGLEDTPQQKAEKRVKDQEAELKAIKKDMEETGYRTQADVDEASAKLWSLRESAYRKFGSYSDKFREVIVEHFTEKGCAPKFSKEAQEAAKKAFESLSTDATRVLVSFKKLNAMAADKNWMTYGKEGSNTWRVGVNFRNQGGTARAGTGGTDVVTMSMKNIGTEAGLANTLVHEVSHVIVGNLGSKSGTRDLSTAEYTALKNRHGKHFLDMPGISASDPSTADALEGGPLEFSPELTRVMRKGMDIK
jgi:RHS repeat-associated protein